MRVGVIGVGEISHWHVRALRAAGLAVAAVSARPGSARLRPFAERHAIPRAVDDWRALVAEASALDALVVATPPDATPDVLAAVLETGCPVLVEKPVAWSAARVAALAARAHERVVVGFNRRFYRPVRAARDEVRAGPPVLAHLALPESVRAPEGGDAARDRRRLRPFFDNAIHGIDLLRFCFGELRVEAVRRLEGPDGPGGVPAGVAALLVSARGDVVQVGGAWGAPANYALTIGRRGRRFDLLPFEVGTAYEGMEVVEPSDACPIRRYVPRPVERVGLEPRDLAEKPGFVAQAEVLRGLLEGRPLPPEAATLHDASAALALCEELVGCAA
jgi:predicted dehydrogenase